MMATTLNDMMERLPTECRQKVKARPDELIVEEWTLRALRKAHDLTQERMAELLDIGEASGSRLEKRSDYLLSILRSYVSAMGGALDFVAGFWNRSSVVLLASLTGDDRPAKAKRRPRECVNG